MKTAFSLLLQGYLNPVELDYEDCRAFQIVCPACKEPVFKVSGGIEDKATVYFSYYRKDETLNDGDIELLRKKHGCVVIIILRILYPELLSFYMTLRLFIRIPAYIHSELVVKPQWDCTLLPQRGAQDSPVSFSHTYIIDCGSNTQTKGMGGLSILTILIQIKDTLEVRDDFEPVYGLESEVGFG